MYGIIDCDNTTIQQTKSNLDQNYAKLCNRMNLEWKRCIKDASGMKEGLPSQAI